jgi:uncharacterized repeat protein (TIGR01451 family)
MTIPEPKSVTEQNERTTYSMNHTTMNHTTTKKKVPIAGRAAGAFLALLVVAALPSVANASTAADTVITNTVTVNYKDSGGVAQTAVTATATVTVTLVPSAVTLSSPANPASIEQGTSATLTYTITGTANGRDTYNLSAVDTLTGITAGSYVTLPASVTLGGTTLAVAVANGNTSIFVPYDGNAGDSAINGIASGDTIVIGANAYVVTAIAENTGSNQSTITIAGPGITGGAVAVGQIVGERQTFTATVASGNVTAASSGTHSVVTTAVSNTSGAATTSQGTATVVTVIRPTLTVDKLVSSNGGTSYATTANAAPGTSLIYKIVVTNTGAGVATSVNISDVIPGYLTYVAGSGKQATSAATAYASATALTEGAAGYDFASNTVTYNPGSPGLGTVAGSGGELVLYFRATVN